MTPLVTPAANLAALAQGVLGGVVGGNAAAIAGHLNSMSRGFTDAGQMALGGRATKLAIEIEAERLKPRDLPNTTFFKDLRIILERLNRGEPIEEIFGADDAARGPKTPKGRRRPPPPGAPQAVSATLPPIEWERFGAKKHPAAREPKEIPPTARAALSYYVHYVGHTAKKSEDDGAVDAFFDISDDRRRQIRGGRFVPKRLGDFPTADARKLIDSSARYESLYGELMDILVTYSILEALGLPMEDPGKDANWQDTLLFDLGFLVAKKLLTEAGKKEVMEDKPLVRVVKRQANLARDNWHPNETRKEIIDRWFREIAAGDEAMFRAKQMRLGSKIARANNWRPPRPDASEALRLQWLVRYWIAREHYGALPSDDLPYSPEAMVRFVFLPSLPKLEPSFVAAMRNMMRGFYGEDVLETLQIKNPGRDNHSE